MEVRDTKVQSARSSKRMAGKTFPRSLSAKVLGIVTRMKSIRSVALGAVLCLGVVFPTKGLEPVSLKLVTGGLVSPMVLATVPDGSGNRVVVDQVGIAYVLTREGKLLEEPFLDLRPRMTQLRDGFDERGFLGFAFHPKFKENGKCYAYFSGKRRAEAPEDWDHTAHLCEFRIDPHNGRKADSKSERVVLQIDEPSFNHNAGRLAFGPDGFLYISVGDGGNGNDQGLGHSENGNGQDKTKLLGKILRIDVDHPAKGLGYGIPKDNPFAQGGGRAEIFAYGIRNPWGISFDMGGAHELFSADVGQSMFEEINIIKRGGNYGWRLREGFIGFNPDNPIKPPEEIPTKAADGQPLIDPIIAYKNFKGHPGTKDLKGTSVTGGYVYRGKRVPELVGRYIFADWSRNWGVPDGAVFVATRPKSGQGQWDMGALPIDNLKNDRIGGYITALGQDEEGEVYVLVNGRNTLTGRTGKVYQIVPKGEGSDL